jgi:uncharacterized membrane protein
VASEARPYDKPATGPRLGKWQIGLLGLLIVVAIGVAVLLALPPENRTFTDAYYDFLEGKRILAGENPYARILSSDMRVNQKYPTYLPPFYYLSALTTELGLTDYVRWVTFWRYIFMLFNVATGCLLYYIFYRKMGVLGGIVGGLFWFLSRWNLHNTRMATFDFIPIFCMVLSIWLLPRRKWASLVLFGISLAFKHLDAYLLPLYLIFVWQAVDRDRVRATLGAIAAIASVPVLTSLPFFLAGPEAFLRSLVFELTRDPSNHVEALSLDNWLNLPGVTARLPLFGMLILIYVLFGRRKLPMIAASLLVMATFIDFNSVLFIQYFSWLVPFILLAVAELASPSRTAPAEVATP